MGNITIYNCHTQIFTGRNAPPKIAPWPVRFITKYRLTRFFGELIRHIIPWTSKDIFDRLANMAIQADQDWQQDILESLRKHYPEGHRKFVILSLDMDYMGAGEAEKNFKVQLEELAELKQKAEYKDEIYPFICADPRRPGICDLVKEYIEQKDFAGIKLYPPLGFFPFDDRLDGVYEYAESNNIPIVTHCMRAGLKTRKKKVELLKEMKKDFKRLTGEEFKPVYKDITDHFTEPDSFKRVLKKYPNLKLSFAHLGGNIEFEKYQGHKDDYKESWTSTIEELLKDPKYPNLYADTAFTFADFDLLPGLKKFLNTEGLRENILFGSDFYVVLIEASEKKFSKDFREKIEEENYRQIAETNPINYLNKGQMSNP